jgi:regulator of RNase E activity RraA
MPLDSSRPGRDDETVFRECNTARPRAQGAAGVRDRERVVVEEDRVANVDTTLANASAAEAAIFDQLGQELYTAVVSDVLDRLGYRDQAMTADIRPVWAGATLIGRAHTVLSTDVYAVPDDPYEMEIRAIDSVPANHVLVAATNKSTRTCLWGELLSTATRVRGGRGAVIDGHTRDIAKITQMGFPVFATGMRPVDSAGRGKIISFGEPVVCGGVLVHEGDIVIADVDGVVVIPHAVEQEAIELARAKVAGENEMRDFLAHGATLREAYNRFGIL